MECRCLSDAGLVWNVAIGGVPLDLGMLGRCVLRGVVLQWLHSHDTLEQKTV